MIRKDAALRAARSIVDILSPGKEHVVQMVATVLVLAVSNDEARQEQEEMGMRPRLVGGTDADF